MTKKKKWPNDLNKHLTKENTIGKKTYDTILNIKTTI